MIVKDIHLLSLNDMNQSDELEQLLDAGASSFKIEGRLKDVSYVKNVTAAYRQKLDAIFARRPEYVRASSGTCNFEFKPQLDKSFSMVNAYACNRIQPNLETLQQIAEILQVDLKDLITDKKERLK